MQPCSFRRRAGCVSVLLLVLSVQAASGGSATWVINPQMENWNIPTNWTPNTVPNSPDDTATFDQTNGNLPVIHSDIELNTLRFTENAPAPITITVGDFSSELGVPLTLSGAGIVNDTDFFQLYLQTVQAAPTVATNGARNVIYLKNNATITNGDGLTGTELIAVGGTSFGFVGGQVQFLDNSVAGVPSFGVGVSASPGVDGGEGGEIWFFDNSSAGNAHVVSGSGLYDAGSKPGSTYFMGTSTAANAYLDNPPTQAPDTEGGKTFFLESSTAGDSIIYAGGGAYGSNAGGGTVIFSDTASAGNAVLSAYGGLSGRT